MKKIMLFLSLLLTVMTALAIPAKRGLWTTIKLADGTEVRVEKRGDEHCHWWQTAEGVCYMSENGQLVQKDIAEIQVQRQARMARRMNSRKVIYASTKDGLGQFGTMSMGPVQSIGEYTIPVVMVQFKDLKFKSTTTVEKMTRYYNEEGYNDEAGCVGSVRDYFKAQSGGQFIPTFEIVGVVTLDKGYAYYGANNGDDEIDVHLDELPGDVIAKAVDSLGVDFSKYVVPAGDDHHTEGVPLMAMFYAGRGEATEYYNAEDYLWPCEWDGIEDPIGQGTYKDVHFNSFFIGNEIYNDKLMGMGVFCHEFGHALGLPDFYCTNYSYSYDDAFSKWSIMDSGSYVSDTYAPVGYTAYEKSFMGWLDLKEVNDLDSVVLESPEGMAKNSAYILRHSATETFIFENRQPSTWYPTSFGSGVMVSRIAYSQQYWANNQPNNIQSKKRACMLTADGSKMYFNANPSHLYGNSATKSKIETLKTLNGTTATIGIKKIVKNNTNGTITLYFTDETLTNINDLSLSAPGSDAVFTLDGRYAGTLQQSLKPGLYISNGRKLIKK